MFAWSIDGGRDPVAGARRIFSHPERPQMLRPMLALVMISATIFMTGEVQSGEAPGLGLPKSPYRSQIRIQTGTLALNGTIHHAIEKERIELVFAGIQAKPKPIIIRRDIGVMWVLTADTRTYLETRIEGESALSAGVMAGTLAEKTAIGPENLNGRPAVKYQVRFAPNTKGEQLSGSAWISPENILIRLDGEVAGQTGKRPFTLHLDNVELGPQPDAAFELPDGYRRVQPSPADIGIREPSRPGRRRSPAADMSPQ